MEVSALRTRCFRRFEKLERKYGVVSNVELGTLNLKSLNCRKALNGVKRLNDWNVWNGMRFGERSGGKARTTGTQRDLQIQCQT